MTKHDKFVKDVRIKLKEIYDLYKAYNKDGMYLTLDFRETDDYMIMSFNNEYWGADHNKRIDASMHYNKEGKLEYVHNRAEKDDGSGMRNIEVFQDE